jgi:membrane peptidoglycan carboxypeptidase
VPSKKTLRRSISALLALSLMGIGVSYYRPLGSRLLVGVANIAVTATNVPVLYVPPLPGTTRLLTASGSLLATFSAQDQIPVALSQVAPVLVRVLLASEDRTFWTNDGIDPRGITRAAIDNLLGRSVQGGSTLTQQYVKNLLITQYGVAYGDASAISRKVREVAYASGVTALFTKRQILTGYLNTVYFGHGAYGIGAAARRYFSTTASNLTAAQSALLVAQLRNPTSYDPVANPTSALYIRNVILAELHQVGYLSSAALARSSNEPLGLHLGTLSSGCISSMDPYFCQWVSSQLLTLPELGQTVAQRQARLDAGNLTITTTLRPAIQAGAQAAVISKVGYGSPIGSAMVMVHPGTGAVVAMVSNRHYGLDTTKNQTSLNYALSGAPVGSTMKLFTLITALEQGVPTGTILPAGPAYHSTVFTNPPGGYFTNAEPFDPTYIDLATATALSVNTAFVQLEQMVGVLAVANTARALGLSIPTTGHLAPTASEGSFTLGTHSFTPLEMAGAYATIAASGLYCVPSGVLSVTFPGNHVVAVPPNCKQVVPQNVASAVASLLAGVVTYGTGTAAAVAGHPLAGKTGTTTNFGAAWFDGFTPTLAAATWVGNPLGPSHPLRNVGGVSAVYGGTLPAEEFQLAMSVGLRNDPPWSIPPLSDAYLTNPQLIVPSLAGLSVQTSTTRLQRLGVQVRGPKNGTVVATTPPPGTPITPGSVVTLKVGAW